jgi:hypothetical protein
MGYLLGRGDILIGDRDSATGAILALTRFHTPMFAVEIKEERATHYNSSDAVKAKDLSVVAQMDGTVNLEIDEFTSEVLAIALGGEVTEQTVGPTFSAKTFPTVVVGKTYAIPDGHVNLSTLTLVDSTGSPVTLSVGVHYEVDLAAGLIKILSLTTVVQPIKASGQVANGASIVSIMTKRGTEKFMRFDGINLADNDKPVIVDIYRAALGTSKIDVKTDGNDVNKCSLTADLLRDSKAPFSDAFGKYGRFVKI